MAQLPPDYPPGTCSFTDSLDRSRSCLNVEDALCSKGALEANPYKCYQSCNFHYADTKDYPAYCTSALEEACRADPLNPVCNSYCVSQGFASPSPVCQRVFDSYCAANLADTTVCQPYCSEAASNCESVGQTYTNNLIMSAAGAPASAPTSAQLMGALATISARDGSLGPFLAAHPEIACFMPAAFYDAYFAQANSAGNVVPHMPNCFYPACAQSNWPNTNYNKDHPCPAIQNCITITDVTVAPDGTVGGGIVVNPDVSCNQNSAPAVPPAPPAPPRTKYIIVFIIVILMVVVLMRKKKALRGAARLDAARLDDARLDDASAQSSQPPVAAETGTAAS